MNVWICFFLMFFGTILYTSLVYDNIPYILTHKCDLFAVVMFVMIWAVILEYFAVKIFQGSQGEVLFTAIFSNGSAFVLHYYFCFKKDDEKNRQLNDE